ncbi:MAG: YihY/virulence factor BrkB family protein [Clostridia bacterium]|nr:YihY/virulence factor BrkB family protein [Clostridia bacterium]
MKGLYSLVRGYLVFKSQKNADTISGALVFFVVLGLVPTVYFLGLLLSFFGLKLQAHNGALFVELLPLFDFLTESATRLKAGGNAFLVFIAIYSSSSAFFHLKVAGEMLYNHKPKNKIYIKISSILANVTMSFLFATVIALVGLAFSLFSRFLGALTTPLLIVTYGFIYFLFALLLNLYACPYKITVKEVYLGALYTTILSVIETLIFIFYVRNFARFNEIYGAISTLVIFLSWAFLIMKTLVGGITLNVYRLGSIKRRKGLFRS